MNEHIAIGGPTSWPAGSEADTLRAQLAAAQEEIKQQREKLDWCRTEMEDDATELSTVRELLDNLLALAKMKGGKTYQAYIAAHTYLNPPTGGEKS